MTNAPVETWVRTAGGAATVGALFRDAGFADVGAARDLAGIWRVSYGRISPQSPLA